jgi:GT2 family glycosyltransferase
MLMVEMTRRRSDKPDKSDRISMTVAVATCGRADALSRCLRAFADQSRLPDEFVVVDQDPSVEVRAAIRDSALPVRYFEQPRLGLSASRNLALAQATGNVLAVTDDDCFPDRGWAVAVIAAMEKEPSLTGVTGPILPPAGEPPANMFAMSSRPSRETRLFSGRTSPWAVGSGANFAARVADLQKIGGWDDRLGVGTPGMAAEDCDIIDRLLAAGGMIRYDGAALMHHDWQTRERRKATRWSYGFGIGALCGLRLASGDTHGLRMLGSYGRMKLREIRFELRNRSWSGVRERLTAISALIPGCLYGVRARSSSRVR